MKRIVSSLLLLCSIWFVAPLAAEAGYMITTIHSPDPNNLGVGVNGVSPTGQVVGDYYDAGGTLRGYLYDPKTGVYTKYGYPGGFPTAVTGLNNSGQLGDVDPGRGDTALALFDWTQRAAETWRGSNNRVRREILDSVCLNRSLSDVNIVTTKRKPFDVFAERLEMENSRGDWI